MLSCQIRASTDVLQSKAVSGTVNLTCDAWQAANVEAYFAVTGHWIEELSVGICELQSAVIGFTLLNNAHSGARLGQALFKVVDHVGIAHKVCHLKACSYTGAYETVGWVCHMRQCFKQ